MIELIVSLNLISTVIGIIWLRQKVQHQATIIESQTKQIERLDKYSNLLTQLTDKLDPNSVLKLLDTEKMLMTKETEVIRRKTIQEVNDRLRDEWSASFKANLDPKIDSTVNEFANFIFSYFSQPYYADKTKRNGDIRTFLPVNADTIISYFEQVLEKQPDQESNP